MSNSRTKNTFLNALGGLIVKMSGFLTAFISRTVFLYVLGIEYAGVSSVFTNVLTVLSFAELGIGTAITYALYKPIAENDDHQIGKLMNAYRKIYTTIAGVIFALGLCLLPFLEYIIKDAPNLKEDLSKALEITWKGVLAIFIVIAIVIIAVSIMSVITKKIENAKQLKEQAKNAENNGGQN